MYWTLGGISGTLTSNDFTTAISGTLTINSDTGNTNVTIKNDLATEGSETFVLQLRTGSTSGPVVATSSNVTINDTSLTPVYSVSLSPSTVAEGATVLATVTTQNISDGTTFNFYITPSGETTPSNGTVTINNSTGSFSFVAKRDVDIESDQTITVTVNDSVGVVAQSTFVITDVTFSLTSSLSATTVIENSSITVTINSTGIPDGSLLRVKPIQLNGNLSNDVTPNSASLTVNNNVASTNFTIIRDGLTGRN